MLQLYNELKYLDVSNFDSSNAIDREVIFASCFKLKIIRL